jgi:hypothetical protein
VPSIDFEIVGADAVAAAAAFDRQAGTTLYDIPRHGIDEFTALFGTLCGGFDARLQPFSMQVPHRDRVRRAIASGDDGFLISGVSVVAVGQLPTDRALQVSGIPAADYGWTDIRITASDEPVAGVQAAGAVGVDCARFVFADADALDAWQHERSVDGLADVVFWGRDEERLAAELAVERTGVAGDDVFGWLNLPIDEALTKAMALERRRNSADYRFAFDFRPHSDHWRVMAAVRASEHEAATIDVGGARMMFAMTSVGDGFFPVQVEFDSSGAPGGIRITVTGD